ncbi:uncharacterized protein [Epargyreus clarus]|uniref:uncharacterized protein n=1 Tax=Epargyreus clarus TaxID=520877 RepID=UPI003C2E510B
MECNAIVLITLCFCNLASSISWDSIRCSADEDQKTPEGKVPDIGRFPWIGVVQHSFYLGGKTRFAITTGVLIHPAYAIAPAEDISKIQTEALTNNTKFIVWQRESLKYIMDVFDYYLHSEFHDGETFASLALLQLSTQGETGVGDVAAPVLPICLPVKGAGVYSDLYAVRMTDGLYFKLTEIL